MKLDWQGIIDMKFQGTMWMLLSSRNFCEAIYCCCWHTINAMYTILVVEMQAEVTIYLVLTILFLITEVLISLQKREKKLYQW